VFFIKLGLVKSVTALILLCIASFYACSNEVGDENSLVGSWTFEFKAQEGNLCTDCAKGCTSSNTKKLSCFWSDDQCVGTKNAAGSFTLQASFGTELINGTAQLEINDCTATPDQAVTFEAGRLNGIQYSGSWQAPAPAPGTTANPNGYKGTLTVQKL
jgi:hypothetical protein